MICLGSRTPCWWPPGPWGGGQPNFREYSRVMQTSCNFHHDWLKDHARWTPLALAGPGPDLRWPSPLFLVVPSNFCVMNFSQKHTFELHRPLEPLFRASQTPGRGGRSKPTHFCPEFLPDQSNSPGTYSKQTHTHSCTAKYILDCPIFTKSLDFFKFPIRPLFAVLFGRCLGQAWAKFCWLPTEQ